jgi:serine/threonine-protein kinase
MIHDRLASALADRYRIERQLGQGGMATVYLAEDLKHDRKVALKVLKPELAAVLGAERFVIEIKTTAALQHPHILPLFDSGTADGFLYYVMPFIDGETLRAKLDRETQLGVDEAVRIATDVANALHYAHTRGVIHRDIKPENILLHDGRPMVADFGIALAVSAAAGGRMTETGLSLGTPHYMSPEQATAEKEITARSDVYSLGSVLYEMLAGQPPHLGGSAQQIIMKIIAETPQAVTALRKSVPENVAAAVAKALEKLPADRFESAKAFAEALGNPAFTVRVGTAMAGGDTGTARGWRRITIAMTTIAAVLALLLVRSTLGPRPGTAPNSPVVRFALTDDPAVRVVTAWTRPFALSPDGRTIVYAAATDSSGIQLWVRTLGEARPRAIEGTDGAANAAISPDGEWVAYIGGEQELRKVRLSGGPWVKVATLTSLAAALSWASNDEIYLEQIGPDAGIQRVSANGGSTTLAIPFDSAAGEVRQRRPLVLRETGVVAYGSSTGLAEPTLVLYRIADGKRVRLGIPGIGPLALIDDRLIYARADGGLMAVALDAKGMRVTGEPVQLTPRVATSRTGSAVGLSEGGTLVYLTAGVQGKARLDVMDTIGGRRSIPGEYLVKGVPRFSPDGRRVVVVSGSGVGGRLGLLGVSSDLWIFDLATGEPTRLTTDGAASSPSWMSDGKRIVYSKVVGAGSELWSIPVDGTAPASRLVAVPGIPLASAAVPDGRSVIVAALSGDQTVTALVRIRLDGSGHTDTLTLSSRDGVRPEDPRVSPDGRWVAYLDRLTSEVWVRSLENNSVLQVSVTSSQYNPVVWGPDSRHVYYLGLGGLVEIELQTIPSLAVKRRAIVRRFLDTSGERDYDLSPDGRSYVVVTPLRGPTETFVVVNWADEARRTWRGGGAK